MQAPSEIAFTLMKCLALDFRIKAMLTVLILSAAFVSVHRASAQVWTKTSAPNKNWTAVTSSVDGTKLAAANNGSIYTSTNSGTTWVLTSAPAKSWTAIASSSNGSILLAAATSGGIYTSTNSGTTWQSNSVPGNFNWDSVAASADGSTLIAGAQIFGPVYYSTNMGVSWRSNGIPLGYWTSVVSSADGTKLAAAWSGTVYLSTNAGAAWTNYNTSLGSGLACSADGSRLLLFINGLSVSTNWGATWSPSGLPSGSSSLVLAASADVKKLVALLGGSLYLSTDLGASWFTTYAPSKAWKAIALSADGSQLLATVKNSIDGIYLWQPPSLIITNSGSNLALLWPTNGTAFNLQMNADLTTTDWVTVTDLPTVTNSQNQIIASPTNHSGFFRLMSQ